jgi:hypothetical protein
MPFVAASIVVGGMVLLGAMTSTHFNVALERSTFAHEGLGDWLVWGRRTSIPPLLILLMVGLTGSVFVVIRRVLLAMSSGARRLDDAIRRRCGEVGHSLRLDEVSTLASFGLLVSVLALAAAWWYFTPLILALLNYVPRARPDDLALLSPDVVTYHNYYRGVFTFVVLISVAVWYPVWRLVKKGQTLHWGLVGSGAVVTCVAIALLHLPYRLLYSSLNDPFEAVRWNDTECSVVGEDAGRILLFCPTLDAPRNRVVAKGDQALVSLGHRNIFIPISKTSR